MQTQANLGRIAELYRTAIRDGLTEDELSQAKNKVLARSVLRSERPMGRLGVAGVSLDVPAAVYPGRRRARGVQSRDGRRPAPAACRTGRSGRSRSSRWARRPRSKSTTMSYVSHLVVFGVRRPSTPPRR